MGAEFCSTRAQRQKGMRGRPALAPQSPRRLVPSQKRAVRAAGPSPAPHAPFKQVNDWLQPRTYLCGGSAPTLADLVLYAALQPAVVRPAPAPLLSWRRHFPTAASSAPAPAGRLGLRQGEEEAVRGLAWLLPALHGCWLAVLV